MAAKKQTAAPKKAGRPSKYSPELLAAICERLASGEPMAQICRDEGMPDPSTVWDWTQRDPDISQAITRARDAGFDQIALDALRIADYGENDTSEDEDGNVRTNNDVIQRSKLRVETRLKLLAKWDPKRYGDRITQEHVGADGGPIEFKNLSDEQLDDRIRQLAREVALTDPSFNLTGDAT